MAGSLAGKAIKAITRRALGSVMSAIRTAAERTVTSRKLTIATGIRRRLPVQRSLDVAVPSKVAWEEWMTLTWLPEGVDRVKDIERDGHELRGHTGGRRTRDWAAEILDEREGQSFAWQSVEGSDCAGLITFHRLSDRLTRLELNLDVVPTGYRDRLALSMHLADRRADTDLRRFKARLELINPDLYDDDLQNDDGDGWPDEVDHDDAP